MPVYIYIYRRLRSLGLSLAACSHSILLLDLATSHSAAGQTTASGSSIDLFLDQHSTAQEEMKMRTPAIAFAALLMLLLLATRAHGMLCFLHGHLLH